MVTRTNAPAASAKLQRTAAHLGEGDSASTLFAYDGSILQMPIVLSSLRVFSELGPEELDRLRSVMSVQAFRRSDHVISARAGRRDVVVLVEGRLRVSSATSTGREVTLHRHCSGSILGLANLLPAPPQALDVFAETNGALLRAPAAEITALMGHIPRLSVILLHEALHQLHDAEEFARRLSQSSVEERVAAALLEAAIPPEGAPILREDLASRAAASRESVSRGLHRLAAQGMVELSGRRVRLCDEDPLRRLASANSDVPCYGGAAGECLSPGTCRCD